MKRSTVVTRFVSLAIALVACGSDGDVLQVGSNMPVDAGAGSGVAGAPIAPPTVDGGAGTRATVAHADGGAAGAGGVAGAPDAGTLAGASGGVAGTPTTGTFPDPFTNGCKGQLDERPLDGAPVSEKPTGLWYVYGFEDPLWVRFPSSSDSSGSGCAGAEDNCGSLQGFAVAKVGANEQVRFSYAVTWKSLGLDTPWSYAFDLRRAPDGGDLRGTMRAGAVNGPRGDFTVVLRPVASLNARDVISPQGASAFVDNFNGRYTLKLTSPNDGAFAIDAEVSMTVGQRGALSGGFCPFAPTHIASFRQRSIAGGPNGTLSSLEYADSGRFLDRNIAAIALIGDDRVPYLETVVVSVVGPSGTRVNHTFKPIASTNDQVQLP